MLHNSIPEAATSVMLSFAPPLPCEADECPRLATWGQLDKSTHTLYIACPQHGYAYECNLSEQVDSIERFVMWSCHNEGKAHMIGPCALTEVPGYEPIGWAEFPDEAWLVEYTQLNITKRLWVVWLPDVLTLELYSDEGWIDLQDVP